MGEVKRYSTEKKFEILWSSVADLQGEHNGVESLPGPMTLAAFDSITQSCKMIDQLKAEHLRLERERDQLDGALERAQYEIARLEETVSEQAARLQAVEKAAVSALSAMRELYDTYQHAACCSGEVALDDYISEISESDAVAIVICEACGDKPSHVGDARGNAFRWQDYRPIAEKAIAAMSAAKDAEIAELRRRLEIFQDAERGALQLAGIATAERDEARECVGRLCKDLDYVSDRLTGQVGTELRSGDDFRSVRQSDFLNYAEILRAAIAATPEHLRNA